jgi:WhiB family redox-sensing transcriptional regulator
MVAMLKPWDFENPLCREAGGEIGGDSWFPDSGEGKKEHQNVAVRVCKACPERVACLEYALHYKVRGIWGGTTYTERANIRKQRNIAAEEIVLHFYAGKHKEVA